MITRRNRYKVSSTTNQTHFASRAKPERTACGYVIGGKIIVTDKRAAITCDRCKHRVPSSVMKPIAVQMSRAREARLPPHTRVVARPTRWGNPYIVGVHGDAGECVKLFERMVMSNAALQQEIKLHLRGFNLACWCKPGCPCHRDVLLRVANE